MNYQETLQYLFAQLPMFQKIGAPAYKADLNNTIALLEYLGNPEKKFKCIHIAGTNGKGSTSHLIASCLQEAGYKTGLYTSPHLIDFRERIKINGVPIPEVYVIDFVSKHKFFCEQLKPSFFEWTVALCFDYFAYLQIDIAVIETGMGGRLDSTNVITPILSVITNISFDHMQFLGDTIPKIAFEKAGIIKKNIPVIIGEYDSETKNIFAQKANHQESAIIFAQDEFCCEEMHIDYQNFECTFAIIDLKNKTKLSASSGLIGHYQQKNFVTAFTSITKLKSIIHLPEEAIKLGFKNVIQNTGFAGRWQKLNSQPIAIADVGHNEAGIQFIIQQLQQYRYQNLHFVLGMVNDKDHDKILKLLPKGAKYYFCKPEIPRGLDANLLAEKAYKFQLYGKIYAHVKDAYQSALAQADEHDLIFVGGSTFTVADVLISLQNF
jgi:dihydrofolate synthase/folylpolyglutamate synthase